MSHAVMRGSPTKAQLYLDGILDELVAETGRQEDRYCLAKILFKCMRDNPQDIRQIEGSTGVEYTNEIVLQRSVCAALALQAAGVKPGQTVLLLGRNHLELTAAYFGTMFAGGLLFPQYMGITAYELEDVLKMSEPVAIFTETENLPSIEQALKETGMSAQVTVFGNSAVGYQTFSNFISGYDDRLSDFWPVDSERENTVMLLSTSGTSGLPKATMLSNRGMIAQLPSIWSQKERFPKPTSLYLNCSAAGWISFTVGLLCTAAYRVPMLTTAADAGMTSIRELIRKYKPTSAILHNVIAVFLLREKGFEPDDLKCFDYVIVGGTPFTDHLLAELRQAVRPDSSLIVGYGMTELHGICVYQQLGTSKNSLGTPLNTVLFKIIDEQGKTLGPNEPGELCFKSRETVIKFPFFNNNNVSLLHGRFCIHIVLVEATFLLKALTTPDCLQFCKGGYFRNVAETEQMFTEDGWYKTGDMVYMDNQEELYFIERIKFQIKIIYDAQYTEVSPTEVESIVSKLEGVQAVAVCGAERGPAALVVPRPGCSLTPQQVHDAVNSALSVRKHLHGGVVFTPSIPLLPNGKLDRKNLKTAFENIGKSRIHYNNNI